MNRDEAIEIARKLKALAEKSEGGEKSAATEKLKRFCSRHGLNEEEYSTEQVRVSISFKNLEERCLLTNVMCMVLETDQVSVREKDGACHFQCSPYEFELIKDAYTYYRTLYREYCEALLIAMVTKNKILNTKKSDKPFSMEPMTEDERKEWDEIKKRFQTPPDTKKDDSAHKSDPTPPPPPPPSEQEVAKKNDRVARILFTMEPQPWQPPRPRAKLFLS